MPTALPVLLAISFCHLLNDMMQALLPAMYPMLKAGFHLDFGQIGLITFTFQLTASLLQPAIGLYTDHHPKPYSLMIGMSFTLIGLLFLSVTRSYPGLLVSAALVGLGSAVFHPESSRVARMASGGRHGFAQSLFQVGGNTGSSVGPLVAAFVVLPRGQGSVAWFSVAALIAILVLWRVGRWYERHPTRTVTARAAGAMPRHALIAILVLWRVGRWYEHHPTRKATAPAAGAMPHHALPPGKVRLALAVLVMLIFSKYIYLVSISSYFTFYLIHRFGVSVQSAQLHLFGFLAAVAAGTIIGGPVGDRFGRKLVIWCSILGVLPFTLALPHVGLAWTGALSVVIGFILASAFSAILVYAQELVPGRVGLISGLFFGLAFGIAGIGAAALGQLADHTSIEFVYRLCAYLPALGLLTAWLPDVELHGAARMSGRIDDPEAVGTT